MESVKEKRIVDLVRFLQKERIMKGRFRLPMTEDRAYAYLLAAYIVEVQFRHREFISNSSVEEQLRQIALGIDDLGTEPAEVQDYGNIMYPIKELLTMRYDAQLFTVFTTNLEPKDIRQRYDNRIADRLNEMMVKIVYNNKTYRTNNVQLPHPYN